MRTIIRVFLEITVLLSGLAGLSGCSAGDTKQVTATLETSTLAAAPLVGRSAPDFEYQNNQGETVSISDLKGKTVVLNFWATWCGPCQIEMPLIQYLATDTSWADQGLVVLTVTDESAETVSAFTKAFGYSFTVLLDSQNAIANAYNIRYLPTTYIIGKDGVISYIKLGAFTDKTELEQTLNSVMK